MTQTLHPVWPLAVGNGRLLLTPCPGTQAVMLTESLEQLKESGATAIITLMSAAELTDNHLPDFQQAVAASGLAWFHLPVPDDDLPGEDFNHAWQAIYPQLLQRLRSGEALAIHCKGGSGRTGLIAAKLMLATGYDAEQAIIAIQALRPKAFSHPAQRDYILNSHDSL